MFILLATIYILAIGKILCQVQVSQEVRYLPSPFLPGRGNLPRHFHRSTSSLQTFPYTPLPTEKSILFANKSNVSVTAQQSANANQQKRRLFISRVESRRMDQYRPFVNPVTTNTTNSSAQNCSNNATSAQNNSNHSTGAENNTDIYDKVILEGDPPIEINSNNSEGPANNGSSSENKDLKKSVTVIPLPVNVTLEDRSSFDGDPCPTGYVRVNGMCVQPD